MHFVQLAAFSSREVVCTYTHIHRCTDFICLTCTSLSENDENIFFKIRIFISLAYAISLHIEIATILKLQCINIIDNKRGSDSL